MFGDMDIEAGNGYAVQAEYGVLTVLLLNNEAYDKVAHFLRPEHFSSLIGQRVYKSISKALAKGESCDVITVYEDLARTYPDNDITVIELGEIAQASCSPRMLVSYAESILGKAQERKLIAAVTQAHELATDDSIDIAERLARIASLIDAAGKGSTIGKEPEKIGDLLPAYLEKLEKYSEGTEIEAIPTGLEKLDDILGGGWKRGKVYVIAARPSVGKSAIAQAACEHAAKLDRPSAMFSQEMTNEEMVDRAISRIGGVSMGFHNKPIGNDRDFEYALQAVEIAKNMPMWMFDGAGLRLQEIASRARTLKRKHGLGLLAIDYLQLCQSVNPRLSRHHQIEEISRGVKVLAKELDIPILLLSQLNRDVEKRTPPRPIMSDLKESGAIEEDADAIIVMWPHETCDSHVLTGFDVVKNRGGKKGTFAARFVGKYQQWHDTDEQLREPEKKKSGSYDF